MLKDNHVPKSVFDNGKYRELPELRDTTKVHIDRVQCTKFNLGLLDARIHENGWEGFSVIMVGGCNLQDCQTLEGCKCSENEGVN